MQSLSSTQNLDPSSRLRKALQEGRANTSAMIKKLETFESQLNGIEQDLQPLQDGTQRYTQAKENISKTLAECGKTYEYFRIVGEVKHIANAPYSSEKKGDIFDAMERLSKAKDFFEKNRSMRSARSILSGVNSMLSTLEEKCVGEFRLICKSVGSTISTIASADGDVDADTYKVVDPLTGEKFTELQSITQTLDALKLVTHLEAYRESRLVQIHATLNEKKKATQTRWDKLYRDDLPLNSRAKNPLLPFLTLVLELLRGELQLWGQLFHASIASIQVFLDLCNVVIDEVDEMISPFLGNEIYDRLRGTDNIHPNNALLIRMDFLDCFLVNYHSFYEVCKPDFRKDSSASISLINMRVNLVNSCVDGIKELLRTSKESGPSLVPNANAEGKSKNSAKGSAAKGDAVQDKSETETFTVANAGEKCDLLPLTNDVLHCCEHLLLDGKIFVNKLNSLSRDIGIDIPIEAKSHSSLIHNLLLNLKTNFETRGDCIQAAVTAMIVAKGGSRDGLVGESASLMNAGHNDGKLSVVDHLNPMSLFTSSASIAKLNRDVHTHSLFDSGEKEAELNIMSGCRYLFLSNNFSKMNEFLRKNTNALMQSLNQTTIEAFTRQVKECIDANRESFCNTIARVLGMLQSDALAFDERYKSTTDKSASGRLIKARFSAFNSGLEALLAQQGAWRISSASLRNDMGKQLADTVIPSYTRFYEQYSTVNFSKRHMDQYVRFTADDARLILLRFFGGSKVDG